eukprot:155926-Hanusia_phi.AAC.2
MPRWPGDSDPGGGPAGGDPSHNFSAKLHCGKPGRRAGPEPVRYSTVPPGPGRHRTVPYRTVTEATVRGTVLRYGPGRPMIGRAARRIRSARTVTGESRADPAEAAPAGRRLNLAGHAAVTRGHGRPGAGAA